MNREEAELFDAYGWRAELIPLLEFEKHRAVF